LTLGTGFLYNPGLSSHRAGDIAMVKADLVEIIAQEAGITKVSAETAVDSILEALKAALARGERIELRGFGVFEVKPRKRGVGRNPRTGEEVDIPAGKTTRFRPGKALGDLS
jgi:DNA-binding protein HU-beta